tara:strand:- start:1162 stop:1449 length:288 start_codon:yes stop_codon:yes gene_type:complete
MESCHECVELIEKLNKEFETLSNEKELYKSKLKEKNDLVIDMVKKEYTKLLEIRAERDKLDKDEDNIVNNRMMYNMYTNQEHNLQCFIIQLYGVI